MSAGRRAAAEPRVSLGSCQCPLSVLGRKLLLSGELLPDLPNSLLVYCLALYLQYSLLV